MIPVTPPDAYDVCLDAHYYRLATLAEWVALSARSPLKGLVWRDADATRHRLLAEAYDRQAAAACDTVDFPTRTYYAQEAARHRAQAQPQERV